ncbi:hypothetical protein FQR65_LT08388 [Abscondita terminalis]|nr:hypothetical protein FQR65_LT08388 [Abscondita terminalis]
MVYKSQYISVFILVIFKYVLTKGTSFKVWGPGLKPDLIVMPARYFFIHINDGDSCSENLLDVHIEGSTPTRPNCRILKNILRTSNCTFIIRYKLYETCDHLKISIKYDDRDIKMSPFKINNWIYPEECYCPIANMETFLDNWECGNIPDQVIKDLSIFESINFDVLRDKIISKYNSPGAISLCHYTITNNKIYRTCYGKHVGFNMFMDNILLSLSRKIVLPDMEFFVNLGDWPLVKDINDHFPIFSWCGSTDTFDIVLPTYDITQSTLENMGRVTMDMLSVQGNVEYKWEDRIPKAFWRGRDSNRERLRLIELSKKHPLLLNASLTNFFFFRNEEHLYGPKTEHISFFKFFDYKYQVSVDGTVAAYRFPYLLAGGSLLMKQESKYYEHFYNDLTPGVHYLSVKADLSDVIEKINWALKNDAQSQKIANTGQNFAVNNLLPKNIFCYHVHLLNEFSKKIVNKISVLNDAELIANKINDCNCNTNNKDEL